MKVEKSGKSRSKTAKRPGRQRSAAADQAILAATLDVLVEEGYGDFSINKVIQRAGVSSATLYRRWATADELVVAALRSIESEPEPIDTGSLDGDLEAFIVYMAEALNNFEDVAIAEASGPRAPEAMRKEAAKIFSKPRMALLGNILERAHQRGELASPLPTDLCWTYIISPIHHWLYLQRRPLTSEFVQSTQILLTTGLRALAESRG